MIYALEHVNEKSGIFDYLALKDVTANSTILNTANLLFYHNKSYLSVKEHS